MMMLLCAALAIAAPPVPAAVEGQPAPKFQLREADLKLHRLEDLAYAGNESPRKKKRPVFVDFFRTDCGPCRATLPELVKLHEKWATRGVDVYLIALLEPEDGRAKLDRYLATQKLPFPVLIDDSDFYAKKYLGSTVALPATFLIDRDGKIAKVKHGAKGTLEEHFGESLAAVTK